MHARLMGLTLIALLAGWLTATAGDESPQEQSLKETLGALAKLTTTLAGIRDADTAQAARPALHKAAESWTEVKTKAGKLAPPDKAEKDRLAKAYKNKLEDGMKKFFVEVGRVRSFAAGKEMLQEIIPWSTR